MGVNVEISVMLSGFGYEVGEGVSVLWCVVVWVKIDIVKLLISYGVNINYKFKGGFSLLFMVC